MAEVGAGQMQQRVQQLEELEVAAAQVVQCCQAMRAALTAQAELPAQSFSGAVTDAAAALDAAKPEALASRHRQQGDTDLQQATAKLQQLLDTWCLRRCSQPRVPTLTTLVSPGASARVTLPGEGPFPLLALPGELQTHVVRFAGLGARLVCRQLRDAYGCPGTTIRQPLRPANDTRDVRERSAPITDLLLQQDEFASKGVQALLRRALCPPRDCWDVLRQHRLHWPGQVTRLELSDDFNPDLELLHTIHSALPNLRELKCAWPDFQGQGADPSVRINPARAVPQFTALTAMTALCSIAYAAATYTFMPGQYMWQPFEGQELVSLAPNLRSLEADMRHQKWGAELTRLTELPHLTQLTLTFAEVLDEAHSTEMLWDMFMSMQGHMCDLLAGTAGRLKSLTLHSHGTYVGGGLGRVLETMTALTRLVLWDCMYERGLPAAWEQLPQLRQLHLGCSSTGWHWVDDLGGAIPEAADVLLASLQSGLPPGLAEVSSPLLHLACDGGVGEYLGEMLSALQVGCKGLTSLALGCAGEGRSAEHLEPLPPWLTPAAGLLQLQRLALVLPAADMGQLACLRTLPLLSALWLHLQYDTGHPLVIAPSARALSMLEPVRDLTLVLAPLRESVLDPLGPCDSMVAGLLAAVADMPALQVLDTLGLMACCSSGRPWADLTRCPPPRLRQLYLRLQTAAPLVGVPEPEASVGVEAVAAAVRSALPPYVRVCTEAKRYWHPESQQELNEGRGAEYRLQPWSLPRPAAV